MMPSEWKPEHKLFPHQVGFTCPPFDFDAAPSDFLRMAPRSVGVHGWMLHVSDYVHGLDQRKKNFGMLEDFVHCMSRNGVNVCGQVGSNWVHASGLGVEGIRQHCTDLSDKYEIKFHMAGYAMVEALRDRGVEKVALNAAYHWPEWWQGTVGFLKEAGFDVIYAGNFHDQGWFDSQEAMTEAFYDAVGISFMPEALSWDAGGNPSEHSWWDGGSLHANLAKSTGFTRQERRYVEVADAPARVRQVHRRMKPHYDHMYKHRTQLGSKARGIT